MQLPSKKERSTNELLEAERREASARDARHRLTVERLRRQVVELQVGSVCFVFVCTSIAPLAQATRLQDPLA